MNSVPLTDEMERLRAALDAAHAMLARVVAERNAARQELACERDRAASAARMHAEVARQNGRDLHAALAHARQCEYDRARAEYERTQALARQGTPLTTP